MKTTILFNHILPYLAVIFLQIFSAGMNIIMKSALNKGMSHYTFVVWRHSIATLFLAPFALLLERERPQMTWGVFFSIVLMGLLEPVMDQNLYYEGMKRATASLAAALWSVLPALTFVIALVFKVEKLEIKKTRSIAKVLGTLLTVGGAMVVTFVKGSIVIGGVGHQGDFARLMSSIDLVTKPNPAVGALMIFIGCVCWASVIMIQAWTLKAYPAKLSLAGLICLAGTVEGALLATVAEWRNPSAWHIDFDVRFSAVLYCGVVTSAVYFLQGLIMQHKGPTFITTFSPLGLILCTIAGCIFLGEEVHLGGLIGAIIIVCGVYSVIWGRRGDQASSSGPSKDQPPSNRVDGQALSGPAHDQPPSNRVDGQALSGPAHDQSPSNEVEGSSHDMV